MNKNFLIRACFLALVSSLSLMVCACNGNSGDEDTPSTEVSIKMLNPTILAGDEELTIVGSNFDKVTSIVFPENINVTEFTVVANSQITVAAPAGFKAGNIVLKTSDGDVTGGAAIRPAAPSVRGLNPASSIGVGELLAIVGNDLNSVKRIIFPGTPQVVIEAIDFRRKGNEEIRIMVPEVAGGPTVFALETSSGQKLETPSINIVAPENPVIPITDETIMLFDFERGAGSRPGALWGGFGAIETEDNGNRYWKGASPTPTGGTLWVFAANAIFQQAIPITDKVFRFDIMVQAPFDPSGVTYTVQWVMGAQWGWCTSGMFPMKEGASTFGLARRWMTVTLDFSTLGLNLSEIPVGDFGMAFPSSPGTIDWSNIGIDNVRIDPKPAQ